MTPMPSLETTIEFGCCFAALHRGPKTLLLPNAWDVASARIFEDAGFLAIGTTSAGIANSLGYSDGQRISRPEMLDVLGRITRAVRVPVTADMESGYGDTPEDIAETTRQVLAAGAVGMNLEDSSGPDSNSVADLDLQKDRIRAAVEAAGHAGIPFVLNARSDIFLHAVGAPETRLARIVERLNAYAEAGAQSLFAPGITDRETIAQIARAVRGPLNILATAGTPPLSELETLGVARVSLGSGPMRATLGLLTRIARELRDQGTFDRMTEGAMTYADANRLMRSESR
jgi:2-methylisocitrate lyase-like PEP mutase family enzyme